MFDYAPFTDDQVASLNAFQESGSTQVFVCINGLVAPGARGHKTRLVASQLGWHCPEEGCNNCHRPWARRFMTDWSWRTADQPADAAGETPRPQASPIAQARMWLEASADRSVRNLGIDASKFRAVVEALVADAERLELARQVLIEDGYFTAGEIGQDLAPRLTEWLEHHRQPEVEEVPDLPCPKCGHSETRMEYCESCKRAPFASRVGAISDDQCFHGDAEHHHRNCLRCSYRWRTNDVLDARKVCAK